MKQAVTNPQRTLPPWLLQKSVWHLSIIAISLLTGCFVWYSHGMTFSLEDLRRLWLFSEGKQAPTTTVALAMLAINVLTTVYIWLFCQIGLLVGLGRTTVFLLFLLFNFNPEYNSVRLSLDPLQGVILLWLVSMWCFLRHHRGQFYRGFFLWALFLVAAAAIEPAVWLWIIGFPLCFLFWPGAGRLVRRTFERIQFIAVFYLLCAALIWLLPFFHHSVVSAIQALAGRLEEATSAMAVLISDDRSFSLAGYDAFLIAWVIVLINAAKNIGLIILGVVIFTLVKRPSAVLPGRIWLFFAFSLGYATLIGALSLLYLGRLQSDLLYVPVTMLALWMCASAVFYLYQRWRTQRMAAQNRLVLLWLMVAYAIASMVQFGPSSDYLREGGVWAYEQRTGAVYASSHQALFYAGENPMEDNPYLIRSLAKQVLPAGFDEQAILLYAVGRREAIPPELANYQVRAVFENRRGDRLYALSSAE